MTLFLKAKWENIIMANYEIDPAIYVLLPKVELDLFDGKAYIVLLVLCLRIPNCLMKFYFGTFEEINLRFYGSERNTVKRGVVFINETIPYPIVAWMANKLYNEHYTVVPTKQISNEGATKKSKF
jgi:uncharacterized protein YqjF (DUF2071 family)